MKAYSVDLRQRIVDSVKAGESRLSVAKRFRVGYQTVRSYLRLDSQGSLEPRKNTRRADRKYTPAALAALKTWLEEKNDLTLKQLQQRLLEHFQIQISQPAIWYRLTALNLTWKKNCSRGRTGAPGCPGTPGRMAGGGRRHAGESTGVC